MKESYNNKLFLNHFYEYCFRCTKDGEEDYNIVFYTNEEPLRSICENGICSWREFEDKLKSFVDPVAENCEV